MLRTAALFPGFLSHNYNLISISYFFEEISFYIALWLFGMKYYEISLDMERLLDGRDELGSFATDSSISQQQEKTARMKKTFYLARIVVSILIILLHIPLLVLTLKTNFLDREQGKLSGVSLVLLSILVLVVASFMTVALWKFT